MSDIVKGVLGGGWSVLVGWIVPAALNVLVFLYLIMPATTARSAARWSASGQGLAVAVAAVVLGLLLAAVQTPLYRILEGYVGWRPARTARNGIARWSPSGLIERSRAHELRRRRVLLSRLDFAELTALVAAGPLDEESQARLAEVRSDPDLAKYRDLDVHRTDAQLGLIREQLARYPVAESQVVPTRLGNAIRRLEEYGYDRFRLDSQRMWYELTAVAPERASKQVDQARATVDLLVCLLVGNVLMSATAAVLASTVAREPGRLVVIAVVLLGLARAWYEVAISSTDDWAAAVRSLVDVGRQPLAASLGLTLPATIAGEREMWALVASLVARPYHTRRAALDKYRSTADRPVQAVGSATTGSAT